MTNWEYCILHTPTQPTTRMTSVGIFGEFRRKNPLFGHGRVGSDSNSTFHCVYNLNSAHPPPKLDSLQATRHAIHARNAGRSFKLLPGYFRISLHKSWDIPFTIVGLEKIIIQPPGIHPWTYLPTKPCRVIHRRHPTMFG